MCENDIHPGLVHDARLSRRTFGLVSLAAVGLAGAGCAQAETEVVERDVEVTTPDGVSDAALFYPPGEGPWPAVLIWTDILGLRPVKRDMGRRLAAQGYTVLVPNPFYRSQRAPVVGDTFNFADPEDRAVVMAMRMAMSDEGVDSDALAYIAFLDAQPQTDTSRRVGVHGYCMGGPLSFRTAAAAPNRIGAVGSFHGGGLVTDQPNSPHLLVANTNAAYLIAVARNDDATDPEAKEVLQATFEATGRPATVEVYPADHGWCVPGNQVYDEAEAERAWAELSRLYEANLV